MGAGSLLHGAQRVASLEVFADDGRNVLEPPFLELIASLDVLDLVHLNRPGAELDPHREREPTHLLGTNPLAREEAFKGRMGDTVERDRLSPNSKFAHPAADQRAEFFGIDLFHGRGLCGYCSGAVKSVKLPPMKGFPGMSPDPFEGCWRRIERARAHRKEAAAEWNAWIGEDAYDSRLEIDDKGHGTLWIEQLSPLPPTMAIAFGEYFYQLRAALDNCIYTVACFDSKQSPPPGEGVIQFPIYETEAGWISNQYRIKPLTEKHRTWLHSIQPYLRKDIDPEETIFALVNNLARKDRHRQLQVVGAYATETSPLVDAPEGSSVLVEMMPASIPLERETVIARFQVIPYAKGDKVEANPNLYIEPELMEWPRVRSPQREWLEWGLDVRLRFLIEPMIEATVGRFERDLIGYTRAKYLRDEAEIDGPSE